MTDVAAAHPSTPSRLASLDRRRPLNLVVRYLLLPFITTGFLILTSINPISIVQGLLAFGLVLVPWVSYQRWRTGVHSGLPLYALIGGLHWLYFAVALFWGDRLAPVWYSSAVLLSDDSITAVMVMVLAGICAMGLGMRVHVLKPRTVTGQRETDLRHDRWAYIRFLLLAGLAVSLAPDAAYLFGEAGRQWIIALQTSIPLLAAILLLIRHSAGDATTLDKALILLFIAVRLTTGLASGWSGSVFYLGVTVALVILLTRRQLPAGPFLLVVAAVIFLQPAKSDFRHNYWYSATTENSLVDRIEFWLNASLASWQEAFSDASGEQLNTYLRQSMLRVSLLTHAANVYEKTPTVVEFQSLKLYEFSVAGLVPRFLWADKPSGNDANRFYQVAYGVTPENRLGNVSIAIGYLIEAYISFGWLGIAGIMFLLGIFLTGINETFFSNRLDLISTAIGLVAATSLMRVETQLGLYLVTTIQGIVVSYLALLPVVAIKQPVSRETV